MSRTSSKQLIDDVVIAQLDAFAFGERSRLAVGAHPEADDDGVRSFGERHITFGDAADRTQQHLGGDFVGRELLQAGGNRFGRTLYVGLDDQRQFLQFAGSDVGEHLLQRGTADGGDLFVALLLFAIGRDLARALFTLDHLELAAGIRRATQAERLDREGRAGGFDVLAAIIQQGADTAPFLADHHDVANMERAALDQHGGDRATALFELGLDHNALGAAVRVGGQFHDLGLQQDRFFQLVEAITLGR